MPDEVTADIPVIDVRVIPPYERHPRVFSVLQALKPGQSFMVISDHEPRPLHTQIVAKFPGIFDWSFAEERPDVWRAVISRHPEGGCGCCCGS